MQRAVNLIKFHKIVNMYYYLNKYSKRIILVIRNTMLIKRENYIKLNKSIEVILALLNDTHNNNTYLLLGMLLDINS